MRSLNIKIGKYLYTEESSINKMNRLYDQFRTDPWITHRFRKYMAGPKRWPWKNQRDLKNSYKKTWLGNFFLGAALTSPFAIWFANRQKTTQGGVPIVKYNRYIHDFPNLEPTLGARKTFRFWFFGLSVLGGVVFATYTIDDRLLRDAWFSRPDLRPFPAMVPKEEMDITERTMYETHYQSWRNKAHKENVKHRTWYRILFPLDADYSVNRNPYAQTHRENVYNGYNNYYAKVGSNHFRHHVNE